MSSPHRLADIATLTARRVGFVRGDQIVLRDISVTVGPDTRLGVIGPNGAGKSTLLRVLAGLERPTTGGVDVAPPTATVGYLAQEPDRGDETVSAHLHRTTGVAAADERLHAAADALAGGEQGAAEAYATALDRWQTIGAADLDARTGEVFSELGLPPRILSLPTRALSGGQAARVALATILLSRFDILLLDEPTNDLDFDGLGRLEAFVAQRGGGVVVVSHDRAFLDRTITSVLELDAHDHGATLYRGGWSAYLEERTTSRRHAEEAFAEYQDRRRTLLDRSRRERQWATTGVAAEKRRPRDNDKAQRGFRINRTEQLAARARRTDQALDRLEPVEKPWEGWQLRFTIGEAPRAGTIVARLTGAVIDRGSFRLGPLDFELHWGERVALLGPNGSGKTTLLDGLLGRLALQEGERWIGPSVVVGELGQRREALSGSGSVLDAFIGATGLPLSDARSLLAKFGLGPDHVGRRPSSLSPGERTRAELAVFQARGVNLLVLDEPTNHLDLPAVEQLEEALAAYSGTLILVSHDRKLLESVDFGRTVELD